MRTTTWYYLRTAPGIFHGVTAKQVRAFHAGLQRLPADGDGYVRYAQLYIQWENRRPAALYGSEFLRFQVDPEGLFDQASWAARVNRVLTDGHMDLSRFKGTNLINACSRFAERRHKHLTTWQPSPGDIAALSQLVRKRLQKAIAGR